MSEESRSKKIIGPTLPPGFIRQSNEIDGKNANYVSEENIPAKPKRVFGPSRPPTEVNDNKGPSERRSRSKSPPPSNHKERISNRDSWMTEMGETDNSLKQDPLNIKARTFIQKRTETSSGLQTPIDPEIRAKERELDEQIKNYNEIHRQKSLQETYEEEFMLKKKAATEIDKQERIFDWERDMNSTVRQMSTKSAKDLVSKSNLNDRFGSSSSKKYL